MSKIIYNSIYVLKVFAAFGVICLHCEFPISGRILNPLSRVAVPLFLIISGYFIISHSLNTESHLNFSKRRLWDSAQKIVRALPIPIALYCIYFYFYGSPIDWNWGILRNFALVNVVPIAPHLWYLAAYLYALALLPLIKKINIRYVPYIVVILLLSNLVLGSYSESFNIHNMPGYATRNFLFMALPMVLIGSLLRTHHSPKYRSKWHSLAYIALFMVTTYIEAYALKTTGLRNEGIGDLYCSTIPLSMAIFAYGINGHLDKMPRFIIWLGKNATFNIYIYHYLLMNILSDITTKNPLARAIFVNPLSIFIVSAIFSTLLYYIGRAYRERMSTRQQVLVE